MSPHCHAKPFQGCQALQKLEKQYPCAVCSLCSLPDASGRSGSNALPGGIYLSRTSLLPLLFNPDFFADVPISLMFMHSLRGTFLLSRGAASPQGLWPFCWKSISSSIWPWEVGFPVPLLCRNAARNFRKKCTSKGEIKSRRVQDFCLDCSSKEAAPSWGCAPGSQITAGSCSLVSVIPGFSWTQAQGRRENGWDQWEMGARGGSRSMCSPASLTCTKGLCAGPLGLSRGRQECLLEQAGMFAKAVKTSPIHGEEKKTKIQEAIDCHSVLDMH